MKDCSFNRGEYISGFASPPLIIGASGGSGTRVVARLARHAGYDLGLNVNRSEDALEFFPFHERWINRFLAAERGHAPMTANEAERMRQDFRQVLARHLSMVDASRQDPAKRWGWKAPRSIYLLPFFHSHFPNLKFIHVLRDGRDMAFSKNQNQLLMHGREILSWRERWLSSAPMRSLLLWERVNLRAAEYGETRLRENYLPLRFEDLCQAPVETIGRMMQFLSAEIDVEAVARAEISPPSSLGRWRTRSAPLLAKLERGAAVSLRKFGYL